MIRDEPDFNPEEKEQEVGPQEWPPEPRDKNPIILSHKKVEISIHSEDLEDGDLDELDDSPTDPDFQKELDEYWEGIKEIDPYWNISKSDVARFISAKNLIEQTAASHLKVNLAEKEIEKRNLERKVETLEAVLNSIAEKCADRTSEINNTPAPSRELYTLQSIELHARKFLPARDPTVYDILPFFDSYIADLENTLQAGGLTSESWESYQENRIPFLVDMLGDFGQGNWTDEEIQRAVEKHEGVDNG